MVPRRSLAVVVAVVLAVTASVAAYAELHSAQQRAYKNATLTSVYVLKGVVPRAESAAAAYAQGLIKATRMPLQFVPAGAVRNLSVIRDREAGYNLPTGEVVVSDMFVSLKANSSLAAETVPKGDVAVSVSVDQTHGVAGLVQPGDRVGILVDINSNEETFLYRSVPVLAVGSTLVPAPGRTPTAQARAAAKASNIITFAVTRTAAARIALAGSGGGGVSGGLYLTLEAAGNSAVSAPAITGANLIPGSPTGAVTSIGGSNAAPAGASGGGHSVATP